MKGKTEKKATVSVLSQHLALSLDLVIIVKIRLNPASLKKQANSLPWVV